MTRLLMNGKVADWSKWRQAFDQNASARKEMGFRTGTLFRNADDPNNVVILWELEDGSKKAREYFKSDAWREVLKRGGSLSGTWTFLDEVEMLKG